MEVKRNISEGAVKGIFSPAEEPPYRGIFPPTEGPQEEPTCGPSVGGKIAHGTRTRSSSSLLKIVPSRFFTPLLFLLVSAQAAPLPRKEILATAWPHSEFPGLRLPTYFTCDHLPVWRNFRHQWLHFLSTESGQSFLQNRPVEALAGQESDGTAGSHHEQGSGGRQSLHARTNSRSNSTSTPWGGENLRRHAGPNMGPRRLGDAERSGDEPEPEDRDENAWFSPALRDSDVFYRLFHEANRLGEVYEKRFTVAVNSWDWFSICEAFAEYELVGRPDKVGVHLRSTRGVRYVPKMGGSDYVGRSVWGGCPLCEVSVCAEYCHVRGE